MFDMFKMLGKINDLKAEAGKIKESLKELTIEAKDTQEMVTVKVTGDKRVISVEFDVAAVLPENKEQLQNAVLEATNKALKEVGDIAKQRIKQTIDQKFPEIAGMGLDKWLS